MVKSVDVGDRVSEGVDGSVTCVVSGRGGAVTCVVGGSKGIGGVWLEAARALAASGWR